MKFGCANCAVAMKDRELPKSQFATMEKISGLTGLTSKIASRLADKSEVFIQHPAELRIVRSMSDQDLRAFAAQHGWRVVRRVGGRQIEFYNDASVRQSA
jgi:hypothetical protein